jgi:hypothetical protein
MDPLLQFADSAIKVRKIPNDTPYEAERGEEGPELAHEFQKVSHV